MSSLWDREREKTIYGFAIVEAGERLLSKRNINEIVFARLPSFFAETRSFY